MILLEPVGLDSQNVAQTDMACVQNLALT